MDRVAKAPGQSKVVIDGAGREFGRVLVPLIADRIRRHDFVLLDQVAIEGQRLDPGRGIEGGLVGLVDPIAAGLPQEIAERALRGVALPGHDQPIVAVAGEFLAHVNEVVPGLGRLQAFLVVDVAAVVLHPRVHVARNGGEIAGLGVDRYLTAPG